MYKQGVIKHPRVYTSTVKGVGVSKHPKHGVTEFQCFYSVSL